MIERFESTIGAVKPVFATAFSGLPIVASASVWMDAIRGWAAFATVLLGVPTAMLIIIYWGLKVRSSWINRNHRGGVYEL